MNSRIRAATAVTALAAALAAILAGPAQTRTAHVAKTPPPSDAPAYYFEEPWISDEPAQLETTNKAKTPPPSDAPAYYFEEPWFSGAADGDSS